MLYLNDHPSYRYLWWKFRSEVFHRTTNYWNMVQGPMDDEALEFMKDIANLLELDAMTWNPLMIMVHQGDPARTCAKVILWDLLNQSAMRNFVDVRTAARDLLWDFLNQSATMDYVHLNHSSFSIIGDYNDLWKAWKAEFDLVPPDDCVEETPTGTCVRSAWQVLKGCHQQLGVNGSGVTHQYILLQEDRIKNLNIAFQEDWSKLQRLQDLSRASVSASSSLPGRGILERMPPGPRACRRNRRLL